MLRGAAVFPVRLDELENWKLFCELKFYHLFLFLYLYLQADDVGCFQLKRNDFNRMLVDFFTINTKVANIVNVGIKDFYRRKREDTFSDTRPDDHWFQGLLLSALS